MQELGVINQLSCGPNYTAASTLVATNTKRITVFVYNNAVLYQVAIDNKGAVWSPDSELPPGFHNFSRECSGIRFRNEIGANVAIVSAKMLG